MNNLQRVLTAIEFKQPDSLPAWDNYWDNFPDKWREWMKFGCEVDLYDYYDIAISIKLGDETLFPSQKKIIKSSQGFDVINDGWGRTVRTNKKDSYFSETIDRILNNTVDISKLQPEPASLSSRFNGFTERVEFQKAKGKCVFAKIGGIYCRSQFVRGEESLLMDMALEEKFSCELFDVMSEHLTNMALETLKRGQLWDTGLFVYDDMAGINAPMFSPAMFEKYFLPRYVKLIKTVKAAGCKHVFFHSDGNILPVMDMLIEAGFEGFNPLEPRCGIDLVKLREKYGKKIVFFGGVCNTIILPRGDKKEIEKHVMPLIELGKEGGLVIGQASIGDDISPEIYNYYMQLVKKYGDYQK